METRISYFIFLSKTGFVPLTQPGTEDAVEKIRHSFPVISARRGTSTLLRENLVYTEEMI